MILGQLWYGWAPRGLEGVNQEQLIAGPWAESGPVPRWRDYQHAKTRGGQRFLIGTVGTRDPRWR